MQIRHWPVLVFVFAAALQGATPCPAPHDVAPGTTLENLASQYLGGAQFAISIALATNARTGDGFHYIANPDDLTGIPSVCIPSKPEARHLQKNWSAYDRAVNAARLPRLAFIDNTLVTIPPGEPVDLVAWVRTDQADRLKTADHATAETWVTVEPHLQAFCREFVRSQKPAGAKVDAKGDTKLTQRLEQRLGLSPSSNKTRFVRIQLDHPDPTTIFRPCMDAATEQANCSVGPPAKASVEHRQWLYGQYYSSYGQSLISEFPWTGLGYTFDWAAGPSSPFQRYGESEFVIQKGAPIKVLEVVSTSQYCAP